LATVADATLLKKVWRRFIRKRLRAHRFVELELARDPLEWLAFDWELDQAVATLSTEARAGRYRAGAPEIIRSAKSPGLTRPLASIQPLDLIFYKAIVSSAEASLLGQMTPWTRPGRFDARAEDESPAESGWFRSFLRRQGQIWRITQNHAFVVETDIANYFPYIHLPTVSAVMLENSSLSHEVVRILEHMLTQFSPLTEYRQRPTLGLPQDAFDCSRVIAHAYLKSVDDEFESEGSADRYSRYMDDIVIGANSQQEALGQIRRIQLALERVGLYPNTAKTRVLPRDVFTAAYLKNENDYLGEVEERLKQQQPVSRSEFRARLRSHLSLTPQPARSWTRVLRRYYTISRRLEDDFLLDLAPRHLVEAPDSARHIFDYLSAFRLTQKRFSEICTALEQLAGVHEDIELLVQEHAATVPNLGDSRLRSAVADWALERVKRYVPESPRIASAAAVVLGKFGQPPHFEALEDLLETMSADSVARQQTLLVLLGGRRLSFDDFRTLTPAAGSQALSHIAFLRALHEAEPRAVKMSMMLLRPILRNGPHRHTVRARLLFLAPVVGDIAPSERSRLAGYRDLLRGNAPRLRDVSGEEWYAK
jgi:hypothetical protein